MRLSQPPNETISQALHDPPLQHTSQTHSGSAQQTHPPRRLSTRTLGRKELPYRKAAVWKP